MGTIRRLELARVGEWGVNSDRITRKDLIDVVDTFSPKRPVAIGHDAMSRDDAPKFGNVLNAALADDGNTLVGDVEFSDALNALYEKGLYDGWSVSIPKRANDGKAYLHHLAFLGATPPKIPELKVIESGNYKYSDGDKISSYNFSGKIKELKMEVSMDELEQLKNENAEIKKNLQALTDKNKELETLVQELKEKKEENEDAKKGGSDTASSPNDAVNKEFSDKINFYEKELHKSRLAAFKAGSCKNVPAGVANQVEALAGRLAVRTDSVNFSDNGKKAEFTELELLGSILQAWPAPVQLGSSGYQYSDAVNQNDVDWSKIAAKM